MVLDNTRVRILIFLTCKLSKVFAEMNLVLIITLLIQKNFRNICNRIMAFRINFFQRLCMIEVLKELLIFLAK